MRTKILHIGFASFYYLVVLYFFGNTPFYADMVSLISHPANVYFNSNFETLIIPENYDTGHPPGIPLLMAVLWKIFEYKLIVSHLFAVFVAAGCLLFLIKINRILFNSKLQFEFLLLFLFHPIILAQTISMSADLFLSCCFLIGIYGVLRKSTTLLLISCVLLSLINLRGLILIAILFFHWIYYTPLSIKSFFKKFGIVLFSLIPFILWNLYHILETGWFLSHSNSPWKEHRYLSDFNWVIANFAHCLFRLFEFGGIFMICISGIYLFHIKKMHGKWSPIFILILFFFILHLFVFIPFQNPILNRYFLPLYMLFIIPTTNGIQYIFSKRNKWIGVIALIFIFNASHFYIYPQKLNTYFGFNWDATLAFTQYTKSREEILNKIELHIPQNSTLKIGAEFPMYQSYEDTDLDKKYLFQIQQIQEADINQYAYLLISNQNGKFNTTTFQEIKKSWICLDSAKNSYSEIKFYQNPIYSTNTSDE